MIVVQVPKQTRRSDGIYVPTESIRSKDAKENLTADEYQELAMRTCNIPYTDKLGMLTHATTGLASEAGEFAAIMQKVYQGHPYDREHALLELGDCCWMIAEACKALDTTLSEVMYGNIKKLKKRYPDGFEAERSLHRQEGDI